MKLSFDLGRELNLFFWMFLCITYGTLWLAPARYARAIEKIQGCLGLSQDRGAIVPRPAARFYACYWWVHYTLYTISAWLLWSQNDAGFCITYINDLLFLLIFDTPFTYWCFRRQIGHRNRDGIDGDIGKIGGEIHEILSEIN